MIWYINKFKSDFGGQIVSLERVQPSLEHVPHRCVITVIFYKFKSPIFSFVGWLFDYFNHIKQVTLSFLLNYVLFQTSVHLTRYFVRSTSLGFIQCVFFYFIYSNYYILNITIEAIIF